MLNSDELGEKGQAHFKEICADAKLVCNQSDRDRTGWDFIVEFPFETAIGAFAPLENRITPLSCHIQVKTLLEKNDTFQMRLSSAERLAKELKPSFVYVFKVNEELQFTSAYLIHILNEPLGKILKRLRKEDAAGSAAPNKKTISMSSKCYGIALAPTGKDLSDALVSACGVDLYAYTTKKVEQLAKLGFEERPCELKMTLLADNTDHLVDVFLGRKKIQAENLSSVQKRFGIPLTMPELSEGKATISIQPSPFDTCTIIVRSDPLSTPAVFKGKVFLPNIPNLPKKLFKIFIETDLFSLTFSKDSWNIATGSNFSVQTPSSWAAYWRLCHVLATGTGTIQITANTQSIRNTLNVTKNINTIDDVECTFWITICDQVSLLFNRVGVTDEPKLSMESMSKNTDRISSLYGMLFPEKGPSPFSFTSKYMEPLANLSSIDMIYVDFIILGSVVIGYYGQMHMTANHCEGRTEWNADNVVLKGMTQLHSFPQQYEELIATAKKETGCENVFARPIEQYPKISASEEIK